MQMQMHMHMHMQMQMHMHMPWARALVHVLVPLRLSPLASAVPLPSAVSVCDGHVGRVGDVGEALELGLLLLVEARPVAHGVDWLLVGERLTRAHDRGSTPVRVAGGVRAEGAGA